MTHVEQQFAESRVLGRTIFSCFEDACARESTRASSASDRSLRCIERHFLCHVFTSRSHRACRWCQMFQFLSRARQVSSREHRTHVSSPLAKTILLLDSDRAKAIIDRAINY